MMIIKSSAFGNFEEAFIEERFENKTNIIFSNDNNRGKTLLLQCLMHSLGYDSIFSSGFNYKSYYFYSKFEFYEKEYEVVRRGNSVLLLENGNLNVFSSISEFKYFFDKSIYRLPRIEKDGEIRPVDLSMFYELFFLGQDGRNTSNLIVKGRHNKQDFKSMVFSILGISVTSEQKYDIEELKKQKKIVERRIATEKRKISILTKNPDIAAFASSAANNIEFKETSRRLSELHKHIAELKKQRNREENRKIKLENLINELNSLNRSLNEGSVKCAECGSYKIIFTNQDFEFDVSNNFVRSSLLQSIRDSIIIKAEIVEELNAEIILEQEQINKLTPVLNNL